MKRALAALVRLYYRRANRAWRRRELAIVDEAQARANCAPLPHAELSTIVRVWPSR